MFKSRYRQRSERDAKKFTRLRDAKKFLWIFIIIFLLFRFVLGFSVVDGVSMNDTLRTGNVLLYTRFTTGISRGDVIAMRLPTGEYYVKRVVALGGDTVDIENGKLYINGEEEASDRYRVKGVTNPEVSAQVYPFTVQEGDVFAIGDNREESIDCRAFGPISYRQVLGIVHLAIGAPYGVKIP